MAFWDRKREDKQDSSWIYTRIKEIDVELAKTKAELLRLDQNHRGLRGLVNKKLKLHIPEEDEPEDQEEKIVNDGFDFLRVQ